MADVDSAKRKPYLSGKNYADMMRTPRSRDVWNTILDRFNMLKEFRVQRDLFATAALSDGLKRAIKNFLAQSERKKPYRGLPFYEMEDFYEGNPGLLPPNPPWTPDNPSTPPGLPGVTVFNVDCRNPCCYCPDKSMEIEVFSTQPMYEVFVTFSDPGTTVSPGNMGGVTEGVITVAADALQDGMVTVEFAMTSAEGVQGDSNINIFECTEDFCECEFEPPVFENIVCPDTLAPSGSSVISATGGKSPYKWKVVGEDVDWSDNPTVNPSNTLNAGVDSCGTFDVTITDDCDQELTCQVRSTVGQWNNINNDKVICGASDGAPDYNTRTVGGQRNFQQWVNWRGCSDSFRNCFCNSFGANECGTHVNNFPPSWLLRICVDQDCAQWPLTPNQISAICCEGGIVPNELCRVSEPEVTIYQLWQCPP